MRPTASEERSSIQQTVASMSWVSVGRLLGRHSTSPRETAMSSSSVITTAMGGNASATSPSAVVMEAMRDVGPRGQHQHVVARAEHARLATVPA